MIRNLFFIVRLQLRLKFYLLPLRFYFFRQRLKYQLIHRLAFTSAVIRQRLR